MELYLQDEQGNRMNAYLSKHSIERFILRYSLLYTNIFNKHYAEVKLVLKEMFYRSEPFEYEGYNTMDRINNRDTYYLKSGYLVFVIDRKTNLILTVKCSPEFNEINGIDDSVAVRRMLKKRDSEDNRFFARTYVKRGQDENC